MAITRFALSNPDANTDTLIYTADRQSVSSVIATNKSVNDVTMRVWVVPQGATTESEYAYLSYDAIIPPQNSLETFRFSFTSQDQLYVRASSAEVSFYLNGIYESVGNQFVTVSSTAPSSPTIGDVWVNDTNDSVYFWDSTIWVNVQSQAQSYVQDEPPSLPAEGSIWLDSNSTANAVDGGYPTVIYTASEPTGLDITDTGTLWTDANDNSLYVWDGTAFISISSSSLNFYTSWVKTAAGGETTLSGNDDNSLSLSYTVGFEQLYLNGVLLIRGDDYIATDGTTITGLTELGINDVVQIISFTTSELANTYTQAQVDALLAAAGAPADDLQPILANRMYG